MFGFRVSHPILYLAFDILFSILGSFRVLIGTCWMKEREMMNMELPRGIEGRFQGQVFNGNIIAQSKNGFAYEPWA
ncbi:hypothetical protein ES319_D11G277900v1 [Gossypium barbadense]|uniref:Uncharacterized protein n=2 Tax=Gossypium TaxID=3633 RepID=A0A0D2R051_GOSRA|nr:hypothetical protein ES319_D11G277900v1 [Gossypium barbadense]KJB44788.1 hypothetical protein B456_007G273400 [Gossypium raimondii]KJB44789.1 hypothetical protein B456_007G273400 [Gossypium raimondii]